MTEKLLLYVVKGFEVAGFDTLEVIAEMNIGNEPGNSIEQIEHFIADQFPDDPEYQRGKKFPPGHKIRIQRFVELFPTTKRRPKDKLVATQECLVYCNCRLPEFGVMFCCGNCCEWFHQDCIAKTEIIPNDIDNWMYLCTSCKV